MEQTVEGTLANPSHRLLTPPPPLYAMQRSKTGRKPQRSSPLAGPAVSVSDAEDISRLRVASSPSLNRDFNALSPPIPRQIVSSGLTRPKSMYSTPSLHPQSLTPHDRSYEPLPGAKQLRRPLSAVLPSTASHVHFLDPHSSSSQTAGNFQNRSGQTYSGYRHIPPLTRTSSKLSTGPLKPLPTITLNEQPIQVPQILIPPPASPTVSTPPKDNSWFITNPYEETPRFSRLGAGGVVMPVSAKGYKRYSGISDPMGVNADSTTNGASGNRRSLLMSSLASTLKLTRSSPNLHQEPSPSSSSRSSSRSSNTDSDSSPAPSATSTFSPASSLYRTRTNSFTDSSSSSSYTLFTPDVVTPSSRTSVYEEGSSSSTTVCGKGVRQAEKISSIAGKDRRKSVSEKSRRGSTFRKFIKLFVST